MFNFNKNRNSFIVYFLTASRDLPVVEACSRHTRVRHPLLPWNQDIPGMLCIGNTAMDIQSAGSTRCYMV